MLNIYLTNLGKYNEGELVGEWVKMPVSKDELQAVMDRIGINEEYEETFITDYETDVQGITIDEYSNLEALNTLTLALENLDECQNEAMQAFMKEGYEFEDALQKVKDGDYTIYTDCSDMADVAEQYAEETGPPESIPENLRFYFDFEAFGRDMSYEGQFVFIGNDCIEIF